MSASKPMSYRMDYVFSPCKTPAEYQNVRIEIMPVDGKLSVLLKTDCEVSVEDVEGILRNLEKDYFRRTRISLRDECRVSIKTGAGNYDVEISDAVPITCSLIPKGDRQ